MSNVIQWITPDVDLQQDFAASTGLHIMITFKETIYSGTTNTSS